MWRLRTRYVRHAPLPERRAPGSNDAEVRLRLLCHRADHQFFFGTVAVEVQNSFGYELTRYLSAIGMSHCFLLSRLHNVCLLTVH